MAAKRAGRGGVPIQTMPNERALISLFFQKLQQEDPDILVAHNLMGFDFDILLSRAVHLKLATWSKASGGGKGGRVGCRGAADIGCSRELAFYVVPW